MATTKREIRARQRWERVRFSLGAQCANYRGGRAVLHMLCIFFDGQFRLHFAGVRREFF